jgi:hypothetical protein
MAKRVLGVGITLSLALWLAPIRAQDHGLGPVISDSAFWRMIATFSEEAGTFRYENLLSNETSYQQVIPSLLKAVRSQPLDMKRLNPTIMGAYLGVGPEQNFTYIAAIEPQISFIIDIRRQNMLEHLVYKALFEVASGRVDFLSRLFSRRPPQGLSGDISADRLFKSYSAGNCDRQLMADTTNRVIDRLTKQHGFPLDDADRKLIQHVLDMFCSGGPQIDYGYVNAPSNLTAPSYAELMTATDGQGQNRGYLANDANFVRVRNMQLNNLIVPLVGDFAGPETLRAIGQYLKKNDMVVTAFYVSNVEQYLNKDQAASFRANVATFPAAVASTLIRFTPPESTSLEPIRHFVDGKLFRLVDSVPAPQVLPALPQGSPTAKKERIY